MARQQQAMNAFPNGVPTLPNGQPDINAIVNKAAQVGGLGAVQPLLPWLYGQSMGETAAKMIYPGQDQAQAQPPAAQQTAGPANLSGPAPFMAGRGTAQPAAPGDQGADTIRSIATESYGGQEAGPAIRQVSQQLRIGPDADLSADQANQVKSAIGRLKLAQGAGRSTDLGNQPQTGVSEDTAQPPQPTSAAEVQNNGPRAAVQAQPGGPARTVAALPDQAANEVRRVLASGDVRQAQQLADRMRAAAAYVMPANKNLGELYKSQAEVIEKRMQPVIEAGKAAAERTGPEREAARAGQTVPQYQGTLKTTEGVGQAIGKRIGEVVEAGGMSARHTINTLDVMNDAVNRAGNNLSTGPGHEFVLKAKQFLQNAFPEANIKGLQESEVVVKLNAYLASEAAKSMTARPSQLEFRTFMANNPGLANSVKGTKVLIDVLRQMKQQDIDLGRLAMNRNNWDNWTDVEDRFYKAHPLNSPFTGKPLNANEVEPGGGGTLTPGVSTYRGNLYIGGNPHDKASWRKAQQ